MVFFVYFLFKFIAVQSALEVLEEQKVLRADCQPLERAPVVVVALSV